MRQLAGSQRSALCDLAAYLLDQFPALAAESRDGTVYALAARRPRHAPAQQRLQRDGEQRRLVPPILEQCALASAVGQRVQVLCLVAAEPREGRQRVRPRQHVDGIDLHHSQLLEYTTHIALAGLLPHARRTEPLRRQRNATGFGERQTIGAAGWHGHTRWFQWSMLSSVHVADAP